MYYFFLSYRCIKGHLKEKVIILVTHQLHFLRKVDKIIVLRKGKVAEMGTYEELMSNKKGRLHMLLEERRSQSENSNLESGSPDSSIISRKSEIRRSLSKSNQNMVSTEEYTCWDNNRYEFLLCIT
jgi:ATP-binding cassette subfamily C (CFTR/MRP) protein 4